MSDEEYSFLSVKRSSWKIHQTLKHSTPLTTCTYMSSLPTVNELDEHSYLSNCNTLRENDEHLQQSTGGIVESRKNGEKMVQELSPHPCVIDNEITSRREFLHTVTPDQEMAIKRSKPSRRKTFRRSSQIKELKKLLIKEKVDNFVIQQLKNIEEATHHNLEVENV